MPRNIAYCLLAMCLLFPSKLQAQAQDSIVLEQAIQGTLDIRSAMSVWTDSLHRQSPKQADQALIEQEFIPLSQWTIPPRFVRGKFAYWFHVRLHNTTADTLKPILVFARFDSIHLYQEKGNWQLQHAYGRHLADQQHLNSLPFPDQSAVALILPPQQRTSYLLRFRTVPGWTQDVRPALLSHDVFLSSKTKPLLQFYLFNGSFIAILLFMAIFSFLQFIQIRDQAILFFTCFLLSLALFFIREFDMTDSWIDLLPRSWLTNVAYVPIKLCQYASYVLFVDRFLNAKSAYPFLHRSVNWILRAILIFFLIERIIWYQDIWLSWKLFTAFRYGFYGVSFYFMFLLLRKTVPLGRYIIIGTLILMASVVITMLVSFLPNYVSGWWDLSNLSSNGGILLQIWFFSLGLGEKRLIAEKEKAQLQQDLMLQEQESTHLQQVNQFKTQFFTHLTHDLRTPLTVIIGLAEDLTGTARQRILANSRKLLHLINQMLDLAKLEGGKPQLHWVQADIVVYLKQLFEPYQHMARRRNRAFHYHIETPQLMMDIDPNKLERILSNLLVNALSYTHEGAQIDVHVEQKESNLMITVSDDGPGIAPEYLDHIFDRFYRIASTEQMSAHGTGLGLALSKQLTELLGGNISVTSEHGKGTQFSLSLPIQQQAQHETIHPTLDLVELDASIPQAQHLSSVANHPAVASDAPSILLIEDNHDLIHYLKGILEASYPLLLAQDGQIGKQLAVDRHPSLIISDIMLPRLDGIRLCRQLKAHPETSDIPIILLTAKVSQEEKEEGLEAGADAYVNKPFRKEELLIRIEQLLSQRQQQRTHIIQNHLLGEVKSQDEQDRQFLEDVATAIETNLNQADFGVEALSIALGLSRSQLTRRLKALDLKPPASLIRVARLNRAKHLLLSTSLTVREVAFELGFKDPSYFAKVFQKQFGQSPAALRSNQ